MKYNYDEKTDVCHITAAEYPEASSHVWRCPECASESCTGCPVEPESDDDNDIEVFF